MVFKYGLCSYPPVLFESPLLLHEAQKPVLEDTIWVLLPPNIPGLSGEVQYVFHGWRSTSSTYPMEKGSYMQ